MGTLDCETSSRTKCAARGRDRTGPNCAVTQLHATKPRTHTTPNQEELAAIITITSGNDERCDAILMNRGGG